MDNSLKIKEQLELATKTVYAQGFNIYALLGRFKKLSKLREPIPDEVIIGVCNQFFKYQGKILNHWPWFLEVLKQESHKYFANQNVKEGANYKKPGGMSLADLLKMAAS